MKKIIILILVSVSVLFPTILLPGCANTKLKHLSGSEFVEKSKEINALNSFSWTDYVGEGSGRIYLEYGYPAFIGAGYRVTVYWTETSDLPLDFSIKQRNGAFPWERNPDSDLPDDLKSEIHKLILPYNLNMTE